MAKTPFSFNKGVKSDGTGVENVKEKQWSESVQGEVAGNVPGGESKSGKGIDIEGPNAADAK